MNRRSFLTAILATCAAPAIVRADSLMRIVPVDLTVAPIETGYTELIYPWVSSTARMSFFVDFEKINGILYCRHSGPVGSFEARGFNEPIVFCANQPLS